MRVPGRSGSYRRVEFNLGSCGSRSIPTDHYVWDVFLTMSMHSTNVHSSGNHCYFIVPSGDSDSECALC